LGFKADLDNPQLYQDLDPQGMVSHILHLPKQCEEAWQKALSLDLPPQFGEVKRVVITGMGGSAIGGDLIQGMASLESLPIVVSREYDLPPVGKETLIIFSSYSGMTEETISSFKQAINSPAKKLVITSGGILKDMAEERGIPVFLIPYQAPPRAALGYTFISLIGILQEMGLLKDKSEEIKEAIKGLQRLNQRFSPTVPLTENPAKALAHRVYGHLIIIYGAGFLSGVARRWKTQLNENSKTLAFFDLLPELNHNSVVGYHFPQQIIKQLLVIFLTSPSLPKRLQLRYELTAQLLEKAGIIHEIITGEGKSPLSQILSLILWGDFVSYYLALLNRVNPSPTPEIDFLKEWLSQQPEE